MAPNRPLFHRPDRHYVAGHRVTLLKNGREAYPAMLSAINAARRQVLLEMYWFDSGRIGRRIALALAAAARRGVEVALLYDSLGSVEAEGEMFAALRAAGVHVVEFNPIAPWRERFNLEKLSRRDHRKILVVDGQVGFTGGINISDLWLPEEEGGEGWRDDMVRVEGPAVGGFVDGQCFGEGGDRSLGRDVGRGVELAHRAEHDAAPLGVVVAERLDPLGGARGLDLVEGR